MAKNIYTFFQIEGIDFPNIGRGLLETVNQITYLDSGMTRSIDGSMTNLPDQEYFTLPSIKIGFNFITIEEYTLLRKLLLHKQIYTIKYYDKDFNELVTHEMYAHPDDLKNFFNYGNSVEGLQDVTITFVATLRENTEYSVKTLKDGVLITIASVKWGRSIQLPQINVSGVYVNANYVLTLSNGQTIKYKTGDRITIFSDTTLTATTI